MKERLSKQLAEALRRVLEGWESDAELPAFSLDTPREKSHGDFACNAALLLAKPLKRPPREIAERLCEELGDGGGLLERIEVAGPGFVNLWLSGSRWQGLLREILAAPESFGRSDGGKGRAVQVEFVSANPTGPLSLGHGRQAVLGDCIGRILEATGFDVTREYYFNNGGRQMRVLGDSVKARYLEQLGLAAPPPEKALAQPEQHWVDDLGGLPVCFPRDGYQGDYIGEIAEVLREEHGDALVEEPGEGLFRQRAEETIFADIRTSLDRLGVHFDVYVSELDLYEQGRIEETLEALRERGLVYEGDGAIWLRATDLGHERDRVLVRSSGEPTYLLPDIAYHVEKFRRGFEQVIDLQGADHIDQFPFVRSAAVALGCDGDRMELVMNQFVTLSSGGTKVKQSTRRATFVTVEELLDEVGVDVFRFFMIQRKPDGHLDFDLDLARETDWKKNPAYYVQYAHARSAGIERRAREAGLDPARAVEAPLERLGLPEELEIMKKLGQFPEVVSEAGRAREPHHVAYYLRELAGLWNPYLQDGVNHRVLADDAELSLARLGLVGGVRQVLAHGLTLLGLSTPEQM
ncbi:MAG: arginine--tRNA ligase [Myxococcota bacterium]